jgi:hypothetical protein
MFYAAGRASLSFEAEPGLLHCGSKNPFSAIPPILLPSTGAVESIGNLAKSALDRRYSRGSDEPTMLISVKPAATAVGRSCFGDVPAVDENGRRSIRASMSGAFWRCSIPFVPSCRQADLSEGHRESGPSHFDVRTIFVKDQLNCNQNALLTFNRSTKRCDEILTH